MREMIPYVMTMAKITQEMEDIKYSHLTRAQREYNIEPIRTEPKINRNDACPCGSGKKYKKCCINR